MNRQKNGYLTIQIFSRDTRKYMNKIKLLLSIVIVFKFALGIAAESAEFKGLDWLEKNRDIDGCIAQYKLFQESKNSKCPEEIELSIRPKTEGKLDPIKTESRLKSGKKLCCYIWTTQGNR